MPGSDRWSSCAELADLAAHALDPAVADYVAAGSGAELSLTRDVAAWDAIPLWPRVLADLPPADISTTLFGVRLSSPVAVAPTGGHGLVHAGGEEETIRGVPAGGLFVLSAYSTSGLEEVAAAAPGTPRWFQLPHEQPPEVQVELATRAAAHGYSALVLTVDQPIMGDSHVGRRGAERLRTDLRFANLPGRHPFVTGYHPRRQGLVPVRQSPATLAELVAASPLPVVVKGVLRADDALRSVDCGAAGVVVSNHGARHLDSTVAPAAALPAVVTALDGRVPVLVDGGVRRGEHVLRALALGADAVLVGRAPLWGLAVDGAAGVAEVLRRLDEQLRRAMTLCGAANLAELGPDLLDPG
jgi:isopentenyl diphosphate isomerase/L-lactate dehydrogenase-like FMN-dependent dehydrogenase